MNKLENIWLKISQDATLWGNIGGILWYCDKEGVFLFYTE